MKKTNLSLALAGFMIAGAVIVSSCKKKDATTTPTTTADTNTNTASDNNMAEQHSNDAENIGAQAVDNGSLSTFRLANGNATTMGANDTVYHVPGTGTYTVTFNGFVGADGHTRNGSIEYSISPVGAHYRDAGMVITVSTPNLNGSVYTVDGNTVSINKTITNNGLIATNSNMQWTINSNLSITKANGGGTFTWVTNNRTHTLLNTNANSTYNGVSVPTAYNGASTPITWSEAVVEINGTASGTSADGVNYTVSTNNVVRNMNCAPISSRPHFHPFVAGTVTFTPTGKTARVINYGTGACDLTYTISIGSFSVTINW
jgi:hypothetical protein